MQNEASSPQVPVAEDSLFNFLRQKYSPASVDTATVRMSTLEIVEQISLHVGFTVEPLTIYQWLQSNGYTYDTVGDLRFEWMLQETDAVFDHGAISEVGHGAF